MFVSGVCVCVFAPRQIFYSTFNIKSSETNCNAPCVCEGSSEISLHLTP